jgi:plastocyanin
MSGQAAKSGIGLLRALAAGALFALASTQAIAATLAVTVHKRDGRPLPGAVVTIEALDSSLSPGAPIAAIMDQVQLAFVPDVLVVPVRSTVQFPNSDAISHQVYSFSSARRFQLPLYRGKPYPPVTFDQPGVVTLGCNIHDNMLAYIVVTAAPFFGRTGADGSFRADDVPPGRYRVLVWHPLLDERREVERILEIGADDAAVVVALTRNLHPAPLTGRPHSWDY